MFPIQKWIKDFFSVSHSQANGILVLLPLLIIILLSEPAWKWFQERRPLDQAADHKALDSLVALWSFPGTGFIGSEKAEGAIDVQKLFVFNPNTAIKKDLLALGFRETIADRLLSYRAKGGNFKIKSDLLKLYGMDTTLYRRLFKFIDLPSQRDQRRYVERDHVDTRKHAEKEVALFDLNLADTTKLMQIHGIGRKLSARIIKYRDALGGFIDIGQVAEVYGLDTIVVHRLSKNSFVKSDFLPSRININTATEAILAAHPYFSKPEARSIVAYRFQHGEFRRIEDLSLISNINENTIRRIMPYLTITDQ